MTGSRYKPATDCPFSGKDCKACGVCGRTFEGDTLTGLSVAEVERARKAATQRAQDEFCALFDVVDLLLQEVANPRKGGVGHVGPQTVADVRVVWARNAPARLAIQRKRNGQG